MIEVLDVEEKKPKKNNNGIKGKLVLGVIFGIMLIGLSYALFQLTLNGTKNQRLTSGTLSFN